MSLSISYSTRTFWTGTTSSTAPTENRWIEEVTESPSPVPIGRLWMGWDGMGWDGEDEGNWAGTG